jgi:hypothetical protein
LEISNSIFKVTLTVIVVQNFESNKVNLYTHFS